MQLKLDGRTKNQRPPEATPVASFSIQEMFRRSHYLKVFSMKVFFFGCIKYLFAVTFKFFTHKFIWGLIWFDISVSLDFLSYYWHLV